MFTEGGSPNFTSPEHEHLVNMIAEDIQKTLRITIGGVEQVLDAEICIAIAHKAIHHAYLSFICPMVVNLRDIAKHSKPTEHNLLWMKYINNTALETLQDLPKEWI